MIFQEIIADENFQTVNSKNSELRYYAAALLELYGAYENEQYVTVWNQHHRDKITYEEAEAFLSDLAYFNSDYHFDNDYIVHDCMYTDEFDALLDETYELEYYMPTKSVIRECFTRRYDYDNKVFGEKEMDDFLAIFLQNERDLEDVQFEIVYSCQHLKKPVESSR
jgi:hypothetical protein